MGDTLVIVVTLLVMVVGIVGVVVPVLPGVPLVGLAGIVATFVLGIDVGGWVLVAVLAALTVVGTVASYVLPARQGVQGGAARSSLAVAGACGVVGFFVAPVVGLVVGAVAGLYVAELRRHGDRGRAWATTRTVVAAYGVGLLIELAAALLIAAVWLVTTLIRL